MLGEAEQFPWSHEFNFSLFSSCLLLKKKQFFRGRTLYILKKIISGCNLPRRKLYEIFKRSLLFFYLPIFSQCSLSLPPEILYPGALGASGLR